MGKRGLRITFAVIFLAILGICLWSALPPREPSYKGKPLSVWLQEYSMEHTGPPLDDERDGAIRHIGTNAIPILLQMLRASDSPLKTRCIELIYRQNLVKIRVASAGVKNLEAFQAFRALGADASNAVPELIEIYNEKISPSSQVRTAASIGSIGPSAMSAIPSMLGGLTATNEDGYVRLITVWALGKIHSDPGLVVPELVKFLHDPDTLNCTYAAGALGEFGTNAESAVPYLTTILNDKRRAIRDAATNALKQIDPEAAARAGVK
jgi:HEAT repeat protein